MTAAATAPQQELSVSYQTYSRCGFSTASAEVSGNRCKRTSHSINSCCGVVTVVETSGRGLRGGNREITRQLLSGSLITWFV